MMLPGCRRAGGRGHMRFRPGPRPRQSPPIPERRERRRRDTRTYVDYRVRSLILTFVLVVTAMAKRLLVRLGSEVVLVQFGTNFRGDSFECAVQLGSRQLSRNLVSDLFER